MNKRMLEVLNLAKKHYIDNGLVHSGSIPFTVLQDTLKLDIHELRTIVKELEEMGMAKEIYVSTFRLVLSKSIRKKIIQKNKASFLIPHWIKLHPHQSKSFPKFWGEKEIRTVFSLKPSYL